MNSITVPYSSKYGHVKPQPCLELLLQEQASFSTVFAVGSSVPEPRLHAGVELSSCIATPVPVKQCGKALYVGRVS